MDEIAAFATSCLTLAYVFAGRFEDALEAGQRAVAMFEARGDLWWAGRDIVASEPRRQCAGPVGRQFRLLSSHPRSGTAIIDLRLKARWLVADGIGLYSTGAMSHKDWNVASKRWRSRPSLTITRLPERSAAMA